MQKVAKLRLIFRQTGSLVQAIYVLLSVKVTLEENRLTSLRVILFLTFSSPQFSRVTSKKKTEFGVHLCKPIDVISTYVNSISKVKSSSLIGPHSTLERHFVEPDIIIYEKQRRMHGETQLPEIWKRVFITYTP